jgi:hypothetical protein
MKKIIILGVHNSGSTLLARIMYFLRVNFGMFPTQGKYGLAFEFPLMPYMQRVVRFGESIDWDAMPSVAEPLTQQLTAFFDEWTPLDSAVKHPYLCAGLTVVPDDVLKNFTFINCTRSLDNSIAGAAASYPKKAADMAVFQKQLYDGKTKVLQRASTLGCTVYDWDYDKMAGNSSVIVTDLMAFLGTLAKQEYIERAISFYDSGQHHFGG